MSEASISLQEIKELLSRHVPPDPVALSMLEPESRELISKAAAITEKLLVEVSARELRIDQLNKDAKNMAAALEMYANQSGDVLFSQNLALCLSQVQN